MATSAATRAVPPQDDSRLVAAAAAFGEVASLLVRSREHAHFAIPDLEWLVVPALENSQFTIVRSPMANDRRILPRAAVLWATVSDDIDAKIRAEIATHPRLSAKERASGNNVWITDIIGERVLANEAVKRLRAGPFKGRKICMIVRGEGSQPILVEHMPAD